VLLTRPEGQALAFAARLTARFGTRVRPVVAPLMVVDNLLPPLPPGPFAGVIFTSVAGVEAARHMTLPRLAWCVGQATAKRATEAGFHARSADGDAEVLVAAILADPPPGPLIHLRGEDSRGEVAERLVSAGLETVSLVVYRQVAQPLPEGGRALLATPGPVILPLFSPRSAMLLRGVAPTADLHLVAMSAAVATAAGAIPRQSLRIAVRPEAAAMLDRIGEALTDLSPP
jgi:uroporphyrinogen-III synthase